MYDPATRPATGTGVADLTAYNLSHQRIIAGSGYLSGDRQAFAAGPVTQPHAAQRWRGLVFRSSSSSPALRLPGKS